MMSGSPAVLKTTARERLGYREVDIVRHLALRLCLRREKPQYPLVVLAAQTQWAVRSQPVYRLVPRQVLAAVSMQLTVSAETRCFVLQQRDEVSPEYAVMAGRWYHASARIQPGSHLILSHIFKSLFLFGVEPTGMLANRNHFVNLHLAFWRCNSRLSTILRQNSRVIFTSRQPLHTCLHPIFATYAYHWCTERVRKRVDRRDTDP